MNYEEDAKIHVSRDARLSFIPYPNANAATALSQRLPHGLNLVFCKDLVFGQDDQFFFHRFRNDNAIKRIAMDKR